MIVWLKFALLLTNHKNDNTIQKWRKKNNKLKPENDHRFQIQQQHTYKTDITKYRNTIRSFSHALTEYTIWITCPKTATKIQKHSTSWFTKHVTRYIVKDALMSDFRIQNRLFVSIKAGPFDLWTTILATDADDDEIVSRLFYYYAGYLMFCCYCHQYYFFLFFFFFGSHC